MCDISFGLPHDSRPIVSECRGYNTRIRLLSASARA